MRSSGIETEEWKLIGLFDAITKVVARINNRVFVGLPLCMHSLVDCQYFSFPPVFA